ncbi:hypothetical protein A1C_03935 [Rickettsia akari str. Hartford]|uniref:Uncharacterized protein n=1 Tax=Rickettsia akari (strain Hartford) TaxID=293614 RepID=A8GNT5_RICAH|nr:hypothetical protein [Rickettsia akari]ABV75060.1 hypothetical protein A1C_03935 [Rickettsia akari str. Hartford]
MRDSDIEDDKKSVLEAIIKSLQDIKPNESYILLDLQHYKQIHLGNMMFSHFAFDSSIVDSLNISHISSRAVYII